MNKLFAISVLLLAGCLTARAQTNVTPAAPAQVTLLGTLHGGHKANTNYSLRILQGLIVALKPAAILVEQPPAIGGHPTVQSGRVTKALSSDEDGAANRAADALSVNVIPFDREGRNEFYRNTRYFSRRDAANDRRNEWLDLQKRQDPHSVHLLVAQLLSEAIARQDNFNATAGPERINSPAYDTVIATKLGIAYDLVPKLLAAAGEPELAAEFSFLADEWQERNRIMARNVQDIARKFPGQRLVVLTGSEHRYLLRQLLAQAPELDLKEFYQVPGWPQKAPPPQ